MNFCILIELSKKKISFLYNRSDGESKFTPFIGDGRALPLAIYCLGNDIQIGQFAVDEAMHNSPYAYTDVFKAMRNIGTYKYRENEYHYNTLLRNAIEKYLAQFFDDVLIGQRGRLEQNIVDMPLCFVFNSDVDENERLFVKDCFEKCGYGNLGTVDYDQIVVEASYFTSNYAVCVTSDGQDLFMSLYEPKTHKYLGSYVISDKGRDPRIEKAIDKLWESLGYGRYYLNLEDERQVLTKLAQDFLSSDEQEFQRSVCFSDGNFRDCSLTKSDFEGYHYNDDGKIAADLKSLLHKFNISPLDCTIVLKDKAANNGYFKHVFKGEFGDLINVDTSFRTKVLSQLLDDIKAANYRFTDPTSKAPLVSDEHLDPVVPTGLIKREVRGKLAEIKGKIRVKNYIDAKKLCEDLLTELHGKNIDAWDIEIDSILKNIPSKNDSPKPENKQNFPKQEPSKSEPPKPVIPEEDPKKYQREVRVMIATSKGKIRNGNTKEALQDLINLKKSMNAKGLYDFDSVIDEVLESIPPALSQVVVKKVKPTTKIIVKEEEKISEAERLLRAGKFSEAKKAFASEGKSDMAQTCSKLIKSKKTIEVYQSGLVSAKLNKDKTAIANAIKELGNIVQMYHTHKIDSEDIEILFNNYKTIK